MFMRIMVVTTSKLARKILSNAFKGSNMVTIIKLQSLWKEFGTLLMKEGQNIQAFFTRVSKIINQIKIYGDMIPDTKIAQKNLRSLLPKYAHIVVAIE